MPPKPAKPTTKPAPPPAAEPADARARLVNAAGPIFAAHGYEHATVRDICDAAKANLAAVNYYFGDKRGLYHAVITEGFERVMRAAGPAVGTRDPGPMSKAEARAALRQFAHRIVEETLGGAKPDWLNEIMMREMVSPTAALDELVKRFIVPQQRVNARAAAVLIGCEPEDIRVTRSVYSIVAQALFYKHCGAVVSRLVPIDHTSPEARRELGEHIADLTLAGLDAAAARQRPAARNRSYL